MADDLFLSLARLRTEVVESTWRALEALPAKARVAEEHVEDEEARDALQPLLGQPAWLVGSLLEAVLSERGSFTASPAASPPNVAAAPGDSTVLVEYRIERHYGTASPELVWSGDTGPRSCARATRYVIDDLFASVRQEVLIAGYSFDRATELFTPLFRRADALVARGEPPPEVRIILDCSRTKAEPGDTPEEIAERTAKTFLETCWSKNTLTPKLQYYVPSAQRTDQGWALYSMHAKCIVVDGEKALVGSANFSTRGRDNRSLEVGALIRDYHFVQSLLAAWNDIEGKLAEIRGPLP